MRATRRDIVKSIGAAGLVAAGNRVNAANTAQMLDVAVIGAGVFGSWTAWHLKQLGAHVGLYDAYGPGNVRSSSGGESRVIRLSYGGDPLYSSMALESLRFWKSLSERQQAPIFHQTGVLWFSPERDEYMRRSLDWLAEQKIDHRSGNADWLSANWPQIKFSANEVGFIEQDTGGLIANRAVQAAVRDSELSPVTARVGPPEGANSDSFALPDGRRARKLVYALGPWLGELFPNLLASRLTVTRQEVFYFGPPTGDDSFSAGRFPVWADFNGGDIVYGLPDIEGRGFKIAFDRHGPVIDPNSMEREPSAQGIATARAYIAGRFPALTNAPLVQARVCQYTNSSNGDFLIDWLPDSRNVLLIGGGSGHGFKHGPAVGRRAAELIVAGSYQTEPRFSLATKGANADRQVY